jgi:hypothetical protein
MGANSQPGSTMKLAPWVLAVALVAAPSLAQTPDPARLALAQKVVGLVFPAAAFAPHSVGLAESMSGFAQMQVMKAEEDAQPDADPAKLPDPDLDRPTLAASLTRAMDAMAPKYEAAIAAAYATSLTADDLTGMLAFFASPAGTAAIAHRKAWADRDAAAGMAGDGPIPDKIAPYVEDKAEKAFDASPPGRALNSRKDAIGAAATQALRALWPSAMAAARDDYCASKPCGEAQRKVFAILADIWNQDTKAAPPAAH